MRAPPVPCLHAACAVVLLLLMTGAPALASPPRLIVVFADADVEAAFAPKSRVERMGRDLGIPATFVRRMALGAQVVELPDGTDPNAAAAAAVASGGATIALPDRRRKPSRIANDPDRAWYLAGDPFAVDAYGAWDITTGAPTTVVAVLDTGIQLHPDLGGRILPGYDFVSDPKVANDGNGRDSDPTDPGDWVSDADLADPEFEDCETTDSTWHGTSVTGILVANANNAQYTAGLDWRAKVLPVRVMGKCGGYDSDILDGVAWAAGLLVPGVPANPNVAQVINLSLGGLDDRTCSPGYDAMLARALSPTGTRAIVAAAGNDDGDADLSVPSSCPSTIAVAATTTTGDRAPYSNRGATVDLAAPGGSGSTFATLMTILVNHGKTSATDAFGITAGAGTSFATPVVAGVIGLVLAVAPGLAPGQVRSILAATATPFPAGSGCTTATCGAGIVDARAAVALASGQGAAAVRIPAVEYYRAGFNHYFMTADADESAGLDAGAYGGVFSRTGLGFNAWNGPAPGTAPVCRFFTTPGRFGVMGSHFYTADPVECDGIKSNPDWIYEKIAFHIAVPVAGACPFGTLPVYRAFNNGQSGAPNHRFTTDPAIYQQFTTVLGWAPEGIKFCAPQ